MERKDRQRQLYYLNHESRLEGQRRRRAEKAEYINKRKEEIGCQICGYNEYGVALDFDHIDPNEKFKSLANMKSFSIERIEEEISKCRVLCANCHRVETWVNNR